MSVGIWRGLRRSFAASLLIAMSASVAFAAEVHGRVTDPLGLPIVGAQLTLVQGGKIVGAGRSASDGSYSMRTGQTGQF